ncbi:O-antigen ligase family protein [Pelagovum pacificum]|uniref:O-antigen ligase family protein n=1 Tax=Pelagovum pacificum TaxID=2588711 RepID=A0A5C5GEY9_9RHOB|nr:O-antigen ligase family protein [Pelagovum pacificum]QQA43548.1 O-antigen ligase family protein [Pelagovum pacificum]TNY33315.1 O-antigen ligase family protein [Pelagovum pacificum]
MSHVPAYPTRRQPVGLAELGALGAVLLVFMSQTDGLFGHLDSVLPGSHFKLTTAAALSAILLTLRNNPAATGRPAPSLPVAATLLFGMWLVVAHLAGPGGAEGEDHLKGFVATLTIVPILVLTMSEPRLLRWSIWAIALSGTVSAALVMLESRTGTRLTVIPNPADIAAWGGEIRSAGASAYNPTTAAQMLMVSVLVSLTMAAEDRSRRIWWLAAALPGLGAIPVMGARSALLGLAVGLVVLLFALRGRRSFGPVALLLGIGAAIALLSMPASMWERLGAMTDALGDSGTADRSLLRRLSYNLIGLELWSRSPISGVGPGIFPQLYATDEFRWYPGRLPMPRQLHNAFLETAVETGIIGLTLFLAATLGAVRAAFRAAAQAPDSECGRMARALAVAFTAFLFASLFMPNEDTKYMWILVALCVRAAWLTKEETG